jgi:hypothetical protein
MVACLFIASLGYGYIFFRAVRIPGQALVVLATIGLAIILAIGGMLNLFHLVSAGSLVAIVLIGLPWGCLATRHYSALDGLNTEVLGSVWRKKSLFSAVLAVSFIVILGRMIVCINNSDLNPGDDKQAYIAFPIKMLQVHTFARDPFSERREINSLGGGVLLQAVGLAMKCGICSLGAIDGCLGLLLLALATWKLCELLDLGLERTRLVFLLMALTPELLVNRTIIILPGAMLLALFVMLFLHRGSLPCPLGIWCGAGVIIGSACTLKMTVIPGVAVVATLAMGRAIYREGRLRGLLCAGVMLASSLLVCIPWMLVSLREAGTLLYPILGHGYHVSNYMKDSGGVAHITAHILFKFLLFALPYLILIFPASRMHFENAAVRFVLIAALVTAVVEIISVGYAAEGEYLVRYCITIIWPCNVIVAAGFLAVLTGAKKWSCSALVGGGVFGVFFGWSLLLGWEGGYLRWLQELRHLEWNAQFPNAAEVREANGIQNAVPRGSAILAMTTVNYAYDFAKDIILIADFPGSASLPPGMPLFQGEKALSGYLVSHHICYVAYSYRDGALFAQEFEVRSHNYKSPWVRREAIYARDFQDNVVRLSTSVSRVYDDGDAYVLDVCKPLP